MDIYEPSIKTYLVQLRRIRRLWLLSGPFINVIGMTQRPYSVITFILNKALSSKTIAAKIMMLAVGIYFYTFHDHCF